MRPLGALLCWAIWLTPALGDGKPTVAWQASYDEAVAGAQKSNKPLLVKFDAPWCGWCRKLDAELEKPELAGLLARFELVSIDIDEHPDVAGELAVQGIPALRILSPRGRLLASQDGFVDAPQLVTWLGQEARDDPEVVAELVSSLPPGLIEAMRITKAFRSRDVTVREAAITRMRAFPKESAAAVIATLRDGGLQARLAALELLQAWKAPVTGLDPWLPESISKDRLAALDDWGRSVAQRSNSTAWEPTPEELEAAKRDVDTSLTATAVDAAVIRERLAKFGAKLLPAVLEKLAAVEDDTQRERLLALRYRLVVAPERALEWSGGIERLASRDLGERRRAADELVKTARSTDETLLLELFANSDPLVRELALRGLQKAAGLAANAALVNLLSDPEPNVRAAVLKQWAENPAPSMLPELEKYLATEKSPDLIVYAVRVLCGLGGKAQPLLITLTKHAAWQVRAEAAEALAKLDENHSPSFGKARVEAAIDKVVAHEAFVELLDDDDAYVASRAVEGLKNADLPRSVKPLLALAQKRPELALAAIGVIAEGEKTRQAAETDLRKLLAHADPAIRAAAITALTHDPAVDCDAELLAALQDAEVKVRIAAARGIMARGIAAAQKDSQESFVVTSVPSPPVGILQSIAGAFGVNPLVPDPVIPPPKVEDQAKSSVTPTPHVEILEKMAESSDSDEAIAAAAALTATGFADEVDERLRALIEATPAVIPELSSLLSVLAPAQRTRLFRLFMKLDFKVAVNHVYSVIGDDDPEPNREVIDLLWQLASDPRMEPGRVNQLSYVVRKAYLGPQYYDPSPSDLKRMAEEAAIHARQGSVPERILAIYSIAESQDDESGLVLAQDVLNAEAVLHPTLAAFAYRLVVLKDSESGLRHAISWGLESGDPDLMWPALAASAGAWEAVSLWTDGDGKPMSFGISGSRGDSSASAEKPFDPRKPVGVTLDHLRHAGTPSNDMHAAIIAYLRILLDDSTDIQPLVDLWTKSPSNDVTRRLLVRAIAYLDDPSLIPILSQVFAQMLTGSEWQVESEVKDFYWTIRIMNGPEITAFRKRVRDESGVSIR